MTPDRQFIAGHFFWEAMYSASSSRHRATSVWFHRSRILLLLSLMGSCLGQSPVLAEHRSDSETDTVRQESRLGVIHFFKPQVWGVKAVKLRNPTPEPVELVTGGYFEGAPLNRYVRQMTVPPESDRMARICILPASTDKQEIRWHSLLYSLDDKAETLLRASDDFLVDSELLAPPPEKLTAYIADLRATDEQQLQDTVELAAAARISLRRTRRLIELDAEDVPAELHGLDVIDEIFLCSNRIADDPARLACLRAWVEQGGRLWIRLDQVDVSTVTHLLGEAVPLQFVDRVSLTEYQLYRTGRRQEAVASHEFDYPVDHVRVLADGVEVIHEVNGWPASFAVTVGRGRVLLTTMGNLAWVRERTDRDKPVTPEYSSNYVETAPLVELIDQWMIEIDPAPLDADNFKPLLASQVGYRVPARWTILSVLWLFCGALLAIGLWLRRTQHGRGSETETSGRAALGRRSEHLAIIGPGLALLAAAPIVVLGQASRHSIPPSVNLAEFVQIAPATSTLQSTGVAAIFAPDNTTMDLAASQGRTVLPPPDDSTGTLQQMVQTDFGQSTWRGLNINTGLQYFTSFQHCPLEQPVSATVSFGPDGVSGFLQAGQFVEPQDAVIASRAADVLAVDMNEQNEFRGGISTTLAPGVYVSGSLLTDVQVTRQDVYRSLFKAKPASRYPRDPLFLAWMRPLAPNLDFPKDFAAHHGSLVAVPLEYLATPPGTDVKIPSPFLTFDPVITDAGGKSTAYDQKTASWRESLQAGETLLRVNLPDAVKPLALSQVKLEIKLLASSYNVGIVAGNRGSLADVASIRDAAGTYQFTLTDSAQLQLDAEGNYYVKLDVRPAGERRTGVESNKAWKVDFIRLEMSGRTNETVKTTETANE
jgi:hypothetical protein